MTKKSLYEAAWILGLLAGIICILFPILGFLGDLPDILERPVKGITDLVSALILIILAFIILGAARMTKSGGEKATTGGLFLIIFGFVAYLVGGGIGAFAAILAGLLAIIARHA
jgi:hypothetical protein